MAKTTVTINIEGDETILAHEFGGQVVMASIGYRTHLRFGNPAKAEMFAWELLQAIQKAEKIGEV